MQFYFYPSGWGCVISTSAKVKFDLTFRASFWQQKASLNSYLRILIIFTIQQTSTSMATATTPINFYRGHAYFYTQLWVSTSAVA
jgi:hypothetical protein